MSIELLTNMLAGTNLSFAELVEAAANAGIADSGEARDAEVPTVAEFYKSVVKPAAKSANPNAKRGGGMFRTYEPYFRLMVEGYPYISNLQPGQAQQYAGIGNMRLNKVVASDVDTAMKWALRRALDDAATKTARRIQKKRAVRHYSQKGAYKNFFHAARFFFTAAIGDRHVSIDPTGVLASPKDLKSATRRQLTEAEYDDVWRVTLTGGDDPELDMYIIETVFVTAARRDGLMNLSLKDLDPARCTIWLTEKGGTYTEQPATQGLVTALDAFARSRGSVLPTDPVFNYKDSAPGKLHRLTDRRFDTLHQRIQETLPWADRAGFTVHHARHHAVRVIRAIADADVAKAFARHADTSVTDRYSRASFEEVCAAFSVMTGFAHPLA